VSRDFFFIFSSSAFDYDIRVIFDFLRKFSEINASQGAPPVSTTQMVPFFRRFSWTTGVVVPAVANLPPVVSITVETLGRQMMSTTAGSQQRKNRQQQHDTR
jgi:hypothetical protein